MVEESLKLAYGENSDFIKDNRIAAVQSLSGTGACRLFADFQKRFLPDSQIYIPVPTWAKYVILCSNNLLLCFCIVCQFLTFRCMTISLEGVLSILHMHSCFMFPFQK